jgi:hypothetical protein
MLEHALKAVSRASICLATLCCSSQQAAAGLHVILVVDVLAVPLGVCCLDLP